QVPSTMPPPYDETVAVLENRPLRGGHFLLSLYSPRQARAARAGQFAMVRLLGRSDVLLRRTMSIYDVKPLDVRGDPSIPGHRAADSPEGVSPSSALNAPAILQLLYKVVGRGTRLMSELKRGDEVGLLAPLGHGFFEEEYIERAKEADGVLHVAGGIGIAALLLPAGDLARAGVRQSLFFGGRTQQDLVGLDDFQPLVDRVVLATEDGSRGEHGYVTQPVEKYVESQGDKMDIRAVSG